MIQVLGGQITVAIRNALLYREMPLISLLEPLMQKKQALLRTSRGRPVGPSALRASRRRSFWCLCPWPMRVTGEATVAAQHLVTVAAPVNGNILTVSAQEGQQVKAGQILGFMNDLQWRMDLTSAEARYEAAF